MTIMSTILHGADGWAVNKACKKKWIVVEMASGFANEVKKDSLG